MPERICVVGLWHLGSVVSACWAALGHPVVGVDRSDDVVKSLSSGRAPLFEPGLDDLIADNVRAGRLTFTTDLESAARDCDVLFLAFDTNDGPDDQLDLGPLAEAIRTAAPRMPRGAVIVVSSQVPVGTCGAWRAELQGTRGDDAVEIAYSPENLRLGEAIDRYLRPDRIVVGSDAASARKRVTALFAPMKAPVLPMSLASAEMTKQALNSYLATSISFINEIADLCEGTGADVRSVVEGLKSDSRIGPRAFLAPGLGFAGGTLGRDVQGLRAAGRAHALQTPLLDAVLTVNARRAEMILRRLHEIHGTIAGLVIAAWGLTYKPGTSTLRRSIALDVIRTLARAGAIVRVFDPRADFAELAGPADFTPVPDAYAAVADASALLVLTEWPEFGELDFDRVRTAMACPAIIDGRNLLTGLGLEQRGFRYMGVGW